MKKLILFSFVALFAVSCEPEYSPSGFGGLEGYLYFKQKSDPLVGYGIRVGGNALTYTDANGYFEFGKLSEGVKKFEVLLDLNPVFSSGVSIISDKVTSVEIALDYKIGELPDFTVVDVSSDVSGWDYWIVGKEEYFYFDQENSKPKSLLFHSFKTGKDCAVQFNAEGLPHFVFAEDYIFAFDNYDGKKVDVGVLLPSGEFKVARGVENNFVWLSPLKSTTLSRAELLRWTGRVAGAIPCVVTGAAALVTGGFAIPLSLWICGNYLLSMANNFYDDANFKNGFTKFIDDYRLSSTFYQFAANLEISSCLIQLASKGLDTYADYIEELDRREEQVEKFLLALENDVPLKSKILQPGSEGKDAWIFRGVYASGCQEYYGNSGNDSLLYMSLEDAEIGCFNQTYKSLIQFSMSSIPVNATVVYAKLEVYGSATINYSNSVPVVGLYEVQTYWNELTTEWIDGYYTEFITSVYFTEFSLNSWYSFDVTSIVRNWVSGEKINYGLLLSPYRNTVYAQICSSDHPKSDKRPKLTIYYY